MLPPPATVAAVALDGVSDELMFQTPVPVGDPAPKMLEVAKRLEELVGCRRAEQRVGAFEAAITLISLSVGMELRDENLLCGG